MAVHSAPCVSGTGCGTRGSGRCTVDEWKNAHFTRSSGERCARADGASAHASARAPGRTRVHETSTGEGAPRGQPTRHTRRPEQRTRATESRENAESADSGVRDHEREHKMRDSDRSGARLGPIYNFGEGKTYTDIGRIDSMHAQALICAQVCT